MAHILLKVKKATQELEQFKIDSNSKTALHIRSLEGVDYQLIDENTGLGPDKVQVKRVGNDLQITFYDEDMQSPNVIIEDYYAHKANVIGEAVDKEIYSYIPESNKELAINALNNELISTVVLPVHNVGLAFNPAWFLTIPTAGLISLFTGHSHNSSSYETVDIKAPTVEISADKTALKIGEEAQITFTFSEVPKDFDLDDIEVKGGTLSHLQPTADGKIWTAVFTPNDNFEDIAELAVAANSYTDAAGNKGQDSEAVNVSVDTVAPTVTVGVDDNALKIGETATVTFTFSEAPQGFESADIEVGGGSISAPVEKENSDGKVWTATFTPDPNTETTTASIKVKGASYTDVAGNNGKEGSSDNIIIDTHKPENTMPPELSLQEDASWSDFGVSVKEGNLANVKVSVEHGQLNITVPSGVTITEGANGSSSLTLKGSESDINTALASLKYQPNSHWSGDDKLTVVSTDNYGQSSTDTTAIKVTAVADIPTLKLTAPEPVDNTTVSDVGGISANYYAVSGGRGGTGMSPEDLIAAFEQATVSGTGVITKFASYDYFDENGARQDPNKYKPDGLSYPTPNKGYKGDPYHSVKVTGLIYLEEGVPYTFGGRVDDAAVMVIGDQIVTYGMWVRSGASGTGWPSDKTPDGLGNVGGTFSGTYIPEKSGYYQFSFYAHNGNGGGGYTFLYKKGDEATHVISTDTATIFNSVEAAEAAGVHLSDLQAGGFYDVLEPNEVTAGHKIQLSTIDAKLVDTDGSETLTIWLEGVPVGVKISDGEHTFEAEADLAKVDITSWKLDSLTFEAPQNMAAGTVQLTVRAVATEQSNGSMAEKVDTMNVKVDAHDQLLASFVPNGASALDKLSAWTAKDA